MYSEISTNKRNSVFLFILFFILIGAIAYVINLFFFQGYLFIIFAAVIAIAFSLISYYSGDKIVLSINMKSLSDVRAAFELSKSGIKILRASGTFKSLINVVPPSRP